MEEILINIDSRYRDIIQYPNEAKFRVYFEKMYKNIIAITINSLEICNCINYISAAKCNNYITIHLPNKSSDPNGTILLLPDGLLQSIVSIKSLFNGLFTGFFNTNRNLQIHSFNNISFAEKYFYVFHLYKPTEVSFNFNFNSVLLPPSLQNKLIINKGWYSVYGLVILIQQYIQQKYNERQTYFKKNPSTPQIDLDNGIFHLDPFDLHIFDRRFRSVNPNLDCIRIDTIPQKDFDINTNNVNNDLKSNLAELKNFIYKKYINDTITFICPKPISSEPGILDKLVNNEYIIPSGYVYENTNLESGSKYHINNKPEEPTLDDTQIYNLSCEINLSNYVYFRNSFTDTKCRKFYYYFVDINGVLPSSWKQSNGDNIIINMFSNLLLRPFLLEHKFITSVQSNDPLYQVTLEYDIADFEIDFNTNKCGEQENSITDGIINIKKLKYLSIGYYMGYRPNPSKLIDKFLINSNIDFTDRIMTAPKFFDTTGHNYIFIKINDWGYIDFFGESLMAKILLTSGLGNPKLDDFVNQGYRFRQPININKLDIELVDYLGNTLDLNGSNFSCTIQLTNIISSDQKHIIEKEAIVFNY
jgi:hypothetical protein